MLINFLTIIGLVVDTKVLATLGTVLGLILADFIFGVLVSLKNGDFSLSKLPQFVKTSVVPYIGGLLALALFSNANAELGALFFTIAATITVKFLADITAKVTQLFNGPQIQSPIPVVKPDVQPQPAPTQQESAQTAPTGGAQ